MSKIPTTDELTDEQLGEVVCDFLVGTYCDRAADGVYRALMHLDECELWTGVAFAIRELVEERLSMEEERAEAVAEMKGRGVRMFERDAFDPRTDDPGEVVYRKRPDETAERMLAVRVAIANRVNA